MIRRNLAQFTGTCVLLAFVAVPAIANDTPQKGKPVAIELGRNGNVTLQAPAAWKRKQPRFKMIDYEFAALSGKDGIADARVTIMGAGGDVKQNIDRWKGQFDDQGRKLTTKLLTISGQEVHVVDIAGTYFDRPAGPMVGGKTTPRENYRVLAAILVTTHGRYYIKMYGPDATVTTHQKAFQTMVKSLTIK